MSSTGNLHKARDALLTALRLNPRDQTNKITARQIAPTYYFEQNYLSAVDTARVPYLSISNSLGRIGGWRLRLGNLAELMKRARR